MKMTGIATNQSGRLDYARISYRSGDCPSGRGGFATVNPFGFSKSRPLLMVTPVAARLRDLGVISRPDGTP